MAYMQTVEGPLPSPFDEHYGLELVECEAELVRARVRVDERLKQPSGVVHGGVYSAIAEATASQGTNAGIPAGMVALGIQNSTSFLRSVSDGSIHALARPLHRGSTLWVWDVEMRDDSEQRCAMARVTVSVRPCR